MTDPEGKKPIKPIHPAETPKLRPDVPEVGARPKVVARPTPTAAPKVIAEHTVTDDDTLSGIALKYYGSAVKKWYMYIYETNKDVIGDDPNIIRPGIVLKILEKPNL